jgi:A/G-specific adenine glycosylase
MPLNKIAKILVQWYPHNARTLPWRSDREPYHVWVAEIMLQQTRVETVIPYYQRWMKKFPTLKKLAESDLQEILRVWEGLGYYSRARNLHKAANILQQKHRGVIPSEASKLIALPGIGRSTAGAIASISFNQDEPILDGNVKRVMSRVFNYEKPINLARNVDELWKLVGRILPGGKVGIFNQALMELGETICLPKRPHCSACPICKECQSYNLGLQDKRPVRIRKDKIPHYEVVAAVIKVRGKFLITQRPQGKILAGLWEFPGGKIEKGEIFEQTLQREIMEELAVEIKAGKKIGAYRHAYSHFSVLVHAFYCLRISGRFAQCEGQQIAWVKSAEFSLYPMGKVDRLIARQVAEDTVKTV